MALSWLVLVTPFGSHDFYGQASMSAGEEVLFWRLAEQPASFPINIPTANFAIALVMAADSNMTGEVFPDIDEMVAGVTDQIGVLLFVDGAGKEGAAVVEVTTEGAKVIEKLPEVCTGDPRPLADFFARALVSYSKDTRFALGFWGHGKGIFGDMDPEEKTLPMGLRALPLGEPVTNETLEDLPPFEVSERMEFLLDLLPKRSLSRSFLPDMTSDNCLTNQEINSALMAAFSRARRTEPVDMIFFDTCLGGSVEVFTEVRRYAETVVVSSLEVPGPGWDYTDWLTETAKARPADAKAWAKLAVESFERTYDQARCEEEAQLGAWATDVDFVEGFGELLGLLIEEMEVEGVLLIAQAATTTERVVYGDNVDFGHLLMRLQELTENPKVKTRCTELLSQLGEARLALSKSPLYRENLSGLSIWCPLGGDVQGVGCYYWNLEFNQITRWWEFLLTPGIGRMMSRRAFMVSGYWGLELSEPGATKRYAIEEDRLLQLPIREEHKELAGGLVEGSYSFEGSAGQIWMRNYAPLKELVEKLLEVSPGFEPLSLCFMREKVLGSKSCSSLAREFEKQTSAFTKNNPKEAELYLKLRRLFVGTADSGAVIFHWATRGLESASALTDEASGDFR